jgi:hypothetical protein
VHPDALARLVPAAESGGMLLLYNEAIGPQRVEAQRG